MARSGFLLCEPLLLAVVVFAACLFGIYTRPLGFLATIWPANAIMLGLLLRRPAMRRAYSWLLAAFAYVAADLLTGSDLPKALLLNGANIVGVGTAYLVSVRFSESVLRLRHPSSLLYIATSAAAGAAASGVIGGIANPIMFNGSVISGWSFWFATEFVNYVAILPVILSAPPFRSINRTDKRFALIASSRHALPILALVLSAVAVIVIGGPGAIAFPVPALLWCGLAYPVFPATLLTLLFGLWSLAVISNGYLPRVPGPFDETALVSVRLAASLIALGPIMLSIVMQNRNGLLARLHHLATHDQLTGTFNRHAFHESAQRLIAVQSKPVAVFMIDLDHFKAVNDSHGHAAGDEVLVSCAERVRDCLRPCDAFGRIGGEEFAAVIVDCPEAKAAGVAERIRNAIAGEPVLLADGGLLTVTVSIGVAVSADISSASFERLLATADVALYSAKSKGRDRVELSNCDVPALIPRTADLR